MSNSKPLAPTTSVKQTTLIYLTAISAGILLISNLAATKLWNMFGVAVAGDIIIEFYGKKVAKSVIFSSILLNILAVLVFWAVCALPPFTGTEEMQASIVNVLGFAPRIILGSLTAYFFSQFSNNYIFVKIKQKTGSKLFLVRALGSSVVAHFLDSLVFETIAFLGVLPFNDFLNQAILAYLLSLGLELVLSPLELLIVSKVRPILNEQANSDPKLTSTSKAN